MIKSSALLLVSTMIKISHGWKENSFSTVAAFMQDRVRPIPREVAMRGWSRFADTGDNASAGNRVPAGKATIVARHVAILASLQINFEVLAEWGT